MHTLRVFLSAFRFLINFFERLVYDKEDECVMWMLQLKLSLQRGAKSTQHSMKVNITTLRSKRGRTETESK